MDRRKNIYFFKKGLNRVFTWSPEFQVDPTGEPVYSEILNETDLPNAIESCWVTRSNVAGLIWVIGPNTIRSCWAKGPTLVRINLGLAIKPEPTTFDIEHKKDNAPIIFFFY